MDQIVRTPAQIGAALRRRRKQLSLSQAALGEKTGLRQATISDIETGAAAASMATLADLMAALDLECVIRPRSKGSADAIEDIF